MKGLRRVRIKQVIVSLSILIAFGLLLNVNVADAQLQYVTIFQGQSATASFSQLTPFGLNSVFVTSIGNRTMAARLGSINPSGTQGFWLLTLLGTGGQNYFDIAGGFIPWGSGQQAVIDIGEGLSFGLATASLFIPTLQSGDQAGVTITIGQ